MGTRQIENYKIKLGGGVGASLHPRLSIVKPLVSVARQPSARARIKGP
jgi:hypothetical protein